jgi:hypothetical protein
MNQKQLDHLKQIINNLQLKELGPNHVHINAVITLADMNLLQEIFSLQKP